MPVLYALNHKNEKPLALALQTESIKSWNMKYSLIIAFLSVILLSCEKKEFLEIPNAGPTPAVPYCEQNGTGLVRIENYFPDPYYLYLDNILQGQIAGSSFVQINLPDSSTYVIRLREVNFVVSPNVFVIPVSVNTCDTLIYQAF